MPAGICCWADHCTHHVGRLAKIFCGRADVDIKLAANLVVIDFRGSLDLLDVRYHIQPGRLRCALGMQRNRLQILHACESVLRGTAR